MKTNNNKRCLAFLLTLALVLGSMSVYMQPDTADAASKKAVLKLEKTKASVKQGSKLKLKIVKKNIKKIKSQKWSSANKKIATVNKKGTVSGKKAGKSTTISCKVKYVTRSSKKTLSKTLKCKVTVKKKDTDTKATQTPEASQAPTGPSAASPTPKPVQTQSPQPSLLPSQTPTASPEDNGSAVVPVVRDENQIIQNPYLSAQESMMHNDVYSSDVTGKAMPLGIHSELIESVAEDSTIAPPAFFYDNYGNPVAPYNQLMEDGSVLTGGIVIRDMDSPNLEVKGKFQPFLHDNGAKYGIQISYSFVDKENYLIGPTTHGHVVMIRTYDEQGNILPVFEKELDVDIVTKAVEELGEDINRNILSVTYDYEGNLWFVTGGFHMDPAYSTDGFVGYLERSYIDKALAGDTSLDAGDYMHYLRLGKGENAENGISGHPQGCVILTNQSCYLFSAGADGVQTSWSYDYESDPKEPKPETGISGAGLAWGGGSTPTLTNDLVLFTDNQKVLNLIALDIKTGKELVKTPVLDLGEDVTVSLENSICVYDGGSGRISVLLCNWFGAGSAKLFEPDADSSIQTYDNIYDKNWRENGSSYLMPGIEKMDIIRQEDGSYKAEKQWTREDLKDTSMIKLSTSAGCYYGYTQLEESSEWGFIALDFDTGKTVLWKPVSTESQYNNMAVGIMQGNNGNSIYCPTDSKVLVRLQDRFAYLPEKPDQKLDIVKMERAVISEKEFAAASGSDKKPVDYLLSAVIDNAEASETLAFRVNNLSGCIRDYTVYYKTADGKLKKLAQPVFADDNGKVLADSAALSPEKIYEVCIPVEDSGKADLEDAKGVIRTSIVLATDQEVLEEKSNEQLYQAAVVDSMEASEDEIYPLVSLTKDDKLVTWDDQGRVLLCTWHNYPDSYPAGEKVTINWGYVWTFTDKEIASNADDLEAAEAPEMRMKQLIGFGPDSKHSTVTAFWVKPEDVLRPAYQSNPTVGSMTTAFAEDEDADSEFRQWFDGNILSSYYYGAYPWTRLGYTYDWADNGKEYGMTEFIVNPGSEVEVEFTETTEEFLKRITNG